MARILIIFFLLTVLSCNKENNTQPFSLLSVKFSDDENYVYMETTEGNFNRYKKIAQLTGTGYRNELFRLYLPNLTDTGNYPNPQIENIFYSDGVDFLPSKVNGGFIHISHIDTLSVIGDFQVSLSGDINGSVSRIVVGGFEINMR